ncbi:acyl carrier protein [Rubellicoccus peritrichatus]|uniref:Phosphopantetheine-binding protein n=1 Tax=Rubellicoccus peritrichatus TaxID=3080537 RepID=A0AAQ3LEA8_9BACT|nr:phosphopantetheine-binding protein [Puniceicoccus sp. CR14]WOO42939.1 phosphopantetheine-binding protein [Puniceicoccus sp. CR14]
MTLDEFTSTWADSIDDLDAAAISEDTPLVDIPQWDSLAVLTTIAMCDAEYGISLTAQEIQSVTTVGELHALVSGKSS